MVEFRNAYDEYSEERHGHEWSENILDDAFLLDLKESIE